MKIKNKTMRGRPPKTPGFSPKVDELARKYFAAKDVVSNSENELASRREEAEGIISQEGTTVTLPTGGKQRVAFGEKYSIALTDVMSTPTLDDVAFYKLLTPAQAAKVFSKNITYVLDEPKLIQAVEDGTIPRKLVQKCTTASAKKNDRFTVTERQLPV